MNKEILKEIIVLYVEDEEDVREFTARTLSNLVKEIHVAYNGLNGLEMFTEHYNNKNLSSFDIIITDINMPKMDGLDMLAAIQKIDSTIPSVVTTAHSDAEFLKQAIDLGVRGYSMKPMNLFQLLKSVSSAVESRVLRKELENKNRELEQQVIERTCQLEKTIKELEMNSEELLYEATHDHLTTLYNRQKLTLELENEIKRFRRYQHNLSIIMFDIDHFKAINDNYGHDIGDEVLIKLSTLSKKTIRQTDTLSRWGGEEFIILLPETSQDGASYIAEKLRIDIESSKLSDTIMSPVTVSFGVTSFKENDDKTTFLKRVDDALYKAKNTGRNKVISN